MKKIFLPFLVAFFLGSTMIQSCKKDNDDSPIDNPESLHTKNPIITPVRLLKSYYENSPNFSGPNYIDTIIYDQNNRVRFNLPQDKYSYKYYESKITLYYNRNNLSQDEIAFTYKLNNLGFPLEITKEITDNDLYGPKKVVFGYESNFINYKVEEYNKRPGQVPIKDSTVYINDGSNITQSIWYRNNQYNGKYYYEFDDKVNPYQGLILELISVEKFMNKNNIIYEEWHTGTRRFKHQYEYIYNSSNLPEKMTSTTLSEGPYIHTFFYSYY